MSDVRIAGITVYPIKSTAGIHLDTAQVEWPGLHHDRRLMLVDKNGVFITGRRYPMLTQVFTGIVDDALVVRTAGREDLHISLPGNEVEQFPVRIWRDQVDAVESGSEANAWFSEFLEIECRLVCMPDTSKRATDPDYSQADDIVSFADAYPVLLISDASLADLNSRLDTPVSMQRFRPNLVVSVSEPYEEDNWQRIRIGDVEFDGVKNCSRCVFTTIDPDTGEKHPAAEPLKTLMAYRRTGNGAFFGQNLIPRGLGNIKIGDAIEVLELAEQPVRPLG